MDTLLPAHTHGTVISSQDWTRLDQTGLGGTDGDAPHGVAAARPLWLQNPGAAVDLIQEVPEHGKGVELQQELMVKLLQGSLEREREREGERKRGR